MKRWVIPGLYVPGAGIALLVFVIFWRSPEPSLVSKVVLADAALVGGCGSLLIAWIGASRAVRDLRTPWIVGGALAGVAAISALSVALWLALSGLLFAIAGALGGIGGWRGLRRRIVLALCAAVVNVAVLWIPQMGDYRPVSPRGFQTEDFRVHSFLSDVPLHDIWAIHLQGGGGGRTIQDLRALFEDDAIGHHTPILIGLGGLRSLLGELLGWDDHADDEMESSYVYRLTESDRKRLLAEPGHVGGMFRSIYIFEREALFEIINRTVHAFFSMGMVPTGDGYTLYWAIYVKPVGPITPYYMALVDPFRRLFVYPVMIRHIEHDWAARWRAEETSGGDPEPAV